MPLISCLFQVEDAANRLSAGDREFLIHPTYGATVKAALNPILVSESASRTQGKKPFDWMLDEQYSNLQVIVQPLSNIAGAVTRRYQAVHDSED